ncbi:MAG: hypothetical protein WCJ53_13955 [Mycobacteriaceae bacterium]
MSVPTDGGSTFTNYGPPNGLGSYYATGVCVIAGIVYAATNKGQSISEPIGASEAMVATQN